MNDSFEEKEQKANNPERHTNWQHNIPSRSPKPVIGGIIIILVGLALLIQKVPGINNLMPAWLFTWPMILILIGIFAAIKNRSIFSGSFPFLIGVFFLLNNGHVINASFQPFLLPVLIILFGLFLILHRNKRNRFRTCRHDFRRDFRKQRRDYHRQYWRNHPPFPPGVPPFPPEGPHHHFNQNQEGPNDTASENEEDYLDINSIFGSAEKNYFSKNFKGGNITCVFGGGKVNLVQSDIQDTAVLNLSINFGGVEILVPANWIIKNELNALFGGIEDKRHVCPVNDENKKILILRGNVLCGGVEIRS